MTAIEEEDFLSCTPESMDQWTACYERMLNETKDKEVLRQMQKIIFRQFMFLFNEWRREAPMAATMGNLQ